MLVLVTTYQKGRAGGRRSVRPVGGGRPTSGALEMGAAPSIERRLTPLVPELSQDAGSGTMSVKSVGTQTRRLAKTMCLSRCRKTRAGVSSNCDTYGTIAVVGHLAEEFLGEVHRCNKKLAFDTAYLCYNGQARNCLLTPSWSPHLVFAKTSTRH